VAFIRRVRTGSGATAVQIAEYSNGRQRIVEHVGSAHTEAELGVLLARARELLEDPAQGALDLAVEPSVPVASIVAAPADAVLFDPSPVAAGGRAGPGRVVGTHTAGCCSTRWPACTPRWGSMRSGTPCSGTW
jgi:hypothetical protein